MNNQIRLSEEDTVPLSSVADGVVGLRTLFVNVYALTTPDRWVLIDAGLYGSSGHIRRWARELVSPDPPAAIVLTHGHFDHVGALPALVEHWDVPVYAHRDELPYLTGNRAYPPADPSVGGGAMAWLSGLYPRRPISLEHGVRPLPADGKVPELPDWMWIHTPGHTPGHVSLFRESDRTLLAGDAFCTTKQESLTAVLTQRAELHGPPAYFTSDWDAARQSVRALAALRPATIAPGHGEPLTGANADAALDELAARFDQIARPSRGRYVAAATPSTGWRPSQSRR